MVSQKFFLKIQQHKNYTAFNTGLWCMSGKGVTVEFSFREKRSINCEDAKSRMEEFEQLTKRNTTDES